MQRTVRDGSESADLRPRLVGVPEAARLLAVSTRSTWRLLNAGELRGVRCGRAVRIVRESIDQFIERGGTRHE